MKISSKLLIAAVGFVLVGCTQQAPRYVGVDNPEVQAVISMGLDRQDFEKAASDAVDSLLRSSALNKPNGDKYIVAIGRIINDTTQKIDTDLFIKKIRTSLLSSGKAVVTSAITSGGNDDELIYQTRDLRTDDEFAQDTIAQKGTILAPELSLTGKIIQQSKTIDKNKLVEFYFQLTLTNLKNGLAVWEEESVIGKVGDKKSVNW
ncbi:MAG: penicillin-binding protein activator LpoB [Campylobacteraceae bacterium]|nr:penicillin-binding protein activator LpoB [Campylobacteraceae bacterium]